MKTSLPPEPQSLEKLRLFLDSALETVDEDEADRIKLAVQEAATNYMKYADKAAEGCPLEVEVVISGRQLKVRIPLFCARGAEGDILPRPLDEVRPGGLGTHFIQEIMDRVEYERGDCGCMTLVLIRTLTSVKS